MKTFALLAGPPGAGKTTYSEKYLRSYYRISRDDHRGREAVVLRTALKGGIKAVSYDAPNLRSSERAPILEQAKECGYLTRLVWFDTPESVCLMRLYSRGFHPGRIIRTTPEEALALHFGRAQ